VYLIIHPPSALAVTLDISDTLVVVVTQTTW